jgi:hypothetical protein
LNCDGKRILRAARLYIACTGISSARAECAGPNYQSDGKLNLFFLKPGCFAAPIGGFFNSKSSVLSGAAQLRAVFGISSCTVTK